MRKRLLCLFFAAVTVLSLAAPGLADGGADEQASGAETAEAVPAAGGWDRRTGGTYYLDDSGRPVTGWQQIDGQDRYFRWDGRLASGWMTIGSDRYYFGDDGVPYTGPRYVGLERDTYLFSQSGVLQRDGTVTLRGTEYPVGSDGVVQGYMTEASRMAAAVLDEVGWDLQAAFDWSSSIPYFGRGTRAPEGVDHGEWFAQYGFTNLRGNCYVMAATFYQMARLLGYDVTFIEGGVGSATGTVIDHSWVELVIDGRLYICDPDFTSEEGRNGFMIWYGKKQTWFYYKYLDGEAVIVNDKVNAEPPKA